MPYVQDIQDLNTPTQNYNIIPQEPQRYYRPEPQQYQQDYDEYYGDYDELPLRDIYRASRSRSRHSNEYKTFVNFLKYKEALDITEYLDKQGVITINRPDKKKDKENKKMSFLEFLLSSFIICGIIKIAIAILL